MVRAPSTPTYPSLSAASTSGLQRCQARRQARHARTRNRYNNIHVYLLLTTFLVMTTPPRGGVADTVLIEMPTMISMVLLTLVQLNVHSTADMEVRP